MSAFRRKVIDLRHRTSGSIRHADFYVELPYMVNVPLGSLAYIDNVSLSHSWPTIRENVTDKFYVQELLAGISGGTIDRIVQLAPGNHTHRHCKAELGQFHHNWDLHRESFGKCVYDWPYQSTTTRACIHIFKGIH